MREVSTNKQKVIIIEGLDNVGKDTLISKICERYPITTIVHCSKPSSDDPDEAAKEQNELFMSYANMIRDNDLKYSDCIIFNRYHMGEYIYGCIYRGRSSEEVLNMIDEVDDVLLASNKDIYYIQMKSSNLDLIIKNDDNKSISKNNRERVETERERFEEVFNHSRLNKLLLDVADKDGNFRTREEIFDDVIRFCDL